MTGPRTASCAVLAACSCQRDWPRGRLVAEANEKGARVGPLAIEKSLAQAVRTAYKAFLLCTSCSTAETTAWEAFL